MEITGNVLLGGMLLIFLLVIGVILFYSAYHKRILKQQQEHQKKEAEYQKQLMRANLQSQEQERNRIGRDLHDEVGSLLTTSKMYFSHLSQADAPSECAELKAKVFELLDETIHSVRRVSLDLRPVVLEQLGLSEAIVNLVHQLNKTGDIRVILKNNWTGRMTAEFELNWYRIIQELLNNTLKHAGATEVHIETGEKEKKFWLVYEDNGRGLSNSLGKSKGLGMQNIESRLYLMEGHMQWIEKKEPGVCIQLWSNVDRSAGPGITGILTEKEKTNQ